jgi:hypothetical protein
MAILHLPAIKNRLDKLIIIYFAIAIFLIPVYWLGQEDLNFIAIFSYAAFIVIPGLAAFSAAVSLKEAGRTWRSIYFRMWMYFSLGTFAWFAAETIWVVYAVFLNIEVPYPSLADIFYLSGNLSFLTGLVVYYLSFANPFYQKEHLKKILPFLLPSIVILSYFSISLLPLLAQDSAFKEAVDSICLLTNSTTIIFAMLSFIVFKGQKKVGAVYSILCPGVILWAGGNLLFIQSDLLGTYYNGAPLELLYLFGYLMISLAFLIHRREF